LTKPTFKDHFSGHAGSYAAHRPSYPDALFSFLADSCHQHDIAWDCATGNGQAARSVAPFFENVVATDASAEQIASAEPNPRIEFRVAPAESSGIDSNTIDLITVAQALHWFDIERFFDEACRVLKPGGVLAVWAYERCHVTPECNEVVENIFAEVESFWPPKREIVDGQYCDITLPVPEMPVDSFDMQVNWTADEMLNYMRTWSATQRYLQANGSDPLVPYEQELRTRWGEGRRDLRWPLTLKAGRKPT
jgi:SAM-dependent methyltransferase